MESEKANLKEKTVKAVLKTLSKAYPTLFRADAMTQHSNALVGYLLTTIGEYEDAQEPAFGTDMPRIIED